MTNPSYLSRLYGSVRRTAEQVRLFGPGALGRFLTPAKREHRWNMRGLGPVTVRIDGSDVSTLKMIFRKHEYDLAGLGSAEKRVDAAYAAILASGKMPVVIDAGANIGAASLWFRQRFPKAAIVAIEPEPGNARILRANIAHLPNVVVAEAAIAGSKGRVDIADGATGWDVTTQRSDAGAFPAITIDDALAMVPGGAPFVAKIDIEGFESDLFAENTGWIDVMTMLVIEPHDWMHPGRFTSSGFQREMGKRRYELFINGENLIYVAE